MVNGNRKLSSVSRKNVCRRDGDVLLRTTTLEDELHTMAPLLLKVKHTSIVPPYMLRVWVVWLEFAFPLMMSKKCTSTFNNSM